MRSPLLKVLFILTALLGIYFSYDAYTGGFSISSISYDWKSPKEWRPHHPSKESTDTAKKILSQPFRYLSRGNQTYAFVSDDGEYVLKFFRFAHLKPSPWLEALPNLSFINSYRHKKRKSQESRLHRIFYGHWLAETKNCENCGLIYVHLDKTTLFDSTVTVLDRIGVTRQIDLDTTIFVLQKKATVAREEFHELLSHNNIAAVKERINQIIALYLSEHHKGIFDRDHNVIDNVAFTEKKAIRIDVGKLNFDDTFKQGTLSHQDIDEKVAKRLRNWTKKYHPRHYQEINSYLDTALKGIKKERYSSSY